jgi:hypothetical protein
MKVIRLQRERTTKKFVDRKRKSMIEIMKSSERERY